MANYYIHRIVSGSINKTFKAEGVEMISQRQSQTTTQISFPRSTPDSTLLNSLLGQKGQIQLSFAIMQRADDYTNGTSAPGDGTPDTQKTYLFEDIFTADQSHSIVDTNGTIINGRITDMEIVKQGDDPNVYRASLTFYIGVTPV
jgi:hypothetical protein